MEKSAKFLSSQQREGRFTAGTACQSTGNPGSNYIKFVLFLVFWLYRVLHYSVILPDPAIVQSWLHRGMKRWHVPVKKISRRSTTTVTLTYMAPVAPENHREASGKAFLSNIAASVCLHTFPLKNSQKKKRNSERKIRIGREIIIPFPRFSRLYNRIQCFLISSLNRWMISYSIIRNSALTSSHDFGAEDWIKGVESAAWTTVSDSSRILAFAQSSQIIS